MVGVVPNAAYRHFADRDELLAAVAAAAMRELAARMAADVARVRGKYGDPAPARRRLRAIGRAYLEFARQEPGLFTTAFAVPRQHDYGAPGGATGPHPPPLDQLRAVLDELADAGVLNRQRRAGRRASPGRSPGHSEPVRENPKLSSRTGLAASVPSPFAAGELAHVRASPMKAEVSFCR